MTITSFFKAWTRCRNYKTWWERVILPQVENIHRIFFYGHIFPDATVINCRVNGEECTNVTFQPFEKQTPCLQANKVHINHPSCCNEEAYNVWLENYLTPLNKYLDNHPYPHFERLYPCDEYSPSPNVHYEFSYDRRFIGCCNDNPYQDYQQWYRKVITPQLDFLQKTLNGDFGDFFVNEDSDREEI